MSTSRVIARAIRDVDRLNSGVARDLERRIRRAYGPQASLTVADIDGVMNIVDDVLAPVYGEDRVRAVQSQMFRSIVGNARIASSESYRAPFVELDRRLERQYGRRWTRLRSRMGGLPGDAPAVFAAVGGRPSRRERRIRARIFDPQRRWVNGSSYRLSDRIWSQKRQHRRNIDAILRHGIRRGDGVETIAHQLRQYASPAAAPIRFQRGRFIRLHTPRRNAFGDGRGAYAARRLARTEVQRVAHEATVEAVRTLQEAIPQAAVRYALSPSHPKIDICDELADGSSRGYPRGVYTPDEVPAIPHPNCLCSRQPWVPSREEVMRDLEARYGERAPRVRSWDGQGDGVYEWDTTEWGDSVDFERSYNRALDNIPGISEEDAYRLALDEAKQDYFLQRGEHLADYFDDYFDDAFVDFDLDSSMTRDMWNRSDDKIDDMVMTTRRSVDLLVEMEEFDDLRPRIHITGHNDFRDAGTIMDYGPGENVIRMNVSHNRFRDIGDLDNMPPSTRWHVSESLESSLIHEYGHARHMRQMIDDGRLVANYEGRTFQGWTLIDEAGEARRIDTSKAGSGWLDPAERRIVDREISSYGASDPLEFVAETYYGLLSGEEYSDEVMALYRRVGGTPPSSRDMQLWDDYVNAAENADRRGNNADWIDDAIDPDDEMFPDMGVMTVGEQADALGISRREYDELIDFALDRGMLDEDDVLDPSGPDMSTLRLILAIMNNQDF